MANYRISYKKTAILAASLGTASLSVCLFVFLEQAIGIPGTDLRIVLPPIVAWSSGLLCLGLTLLSYAVALGGLLALQYDRKGRAVF